MDEFNSKNEVGEDIEYFDTTSDEQESESEHFRENIRKRKNAVDTCADKVVEMLKTKRSLSLNHTRKEVWLAHSFKLRAILLLASTVWPKSMLENDD